MIIKPEPGDLDTDLLTRNPDHGLKKPAKNCLIDSFNFKPSGSHLLFSSGKR
jgi:hypothetical protein